MSRAALVVCAAGRGPSALIGRRSKKLERNAHRRRNVRNSPCNLVTPKGAAELQRTCTWVHPP
eukprot:5836989-Prymnesium_polylepis.1